MSIRSLLKEFNNLNIENNNDEDLEKLISESSSYSSKIRKNYELYILCNVPLCFKKFQGRIKNANKHERFHCMKCWNN